MTSKAAIAINNLREWRANAAATTTPKQLLNPTFYSKALALLAVFAVSILMLEQMTNVDLLIEDYYFDKDLGIFPWVSTWFADNFAHRIVKNVIVSIGSIMLAIVLIDLIVLGRLLSLATRPKWRIVAISSLLIPAVAKAIKRHSIMECPWDLERYGGKGHYLKLLDPIPANWAVAHGHCFPAGHATTGLWLAAFCVFWLPHSPRKAFFVFISGLSVGFAMGWIQQMRGAHFLSHTLWSTWIAGAVILSLIFVFSLFTKASKVPPRGW